MSRQVTPVSHSRTAPTGCVGQVVGSLSVMPKKPAGIRVVAADADVAGRTLVASPTATTMTARRASTVERERVMK